MNDRRLSYRLRNFDYSREGLYFITICCQHMRCYLGYVDDEKTILSQWGRIADQCWQNIPLHYPNVTLHEYVIMPNHIHALLEFNKHLKPAAPDPSDDYPHGTTLTISSVIRGFKAGVTQSIGRSIWQRSYYDHVIRNHDAYANIIDYILNNPIRWQKDRFYAER